MSQSYLREQLETVRRQIASGEVGLNDYRSAMRGQMESMADVIGSVPLMAEVAGAGPEAVERLRESAAQIVGEFRRLLDEGPES